MTMYSDDMDDMQDRFDARVTRVLERRVEVHGPVDFAARVSAALPPQRRPRAAMQLGRRTALAALVVLGISLLCWRPMLRLRLGIWRSILS